MGQVHYDLVELERLVAMSDFIAIARPDDPAYEEVSVEIDEPTTAGSPCPPFVYVQRHYVVDEVLRGEARSTCTIDPADLDWRRDMHREYYVVGISRSPVHPRFEGPPVDGDGPRLVFASREKGGRLEFPVANAEAGLDRLDEVRAQLAPASTKAAPALAGLFVLGLVTLAGLAGLAYLLLGLVS